MNAPATTPDAANAILLEAAAEVWGPQEPAPEGVPATASEEQGTDPSTSESETEKQTAPGAASARIAAARRAEAKAERERVELRTQRESLEAQRVAQETRENELKLIEEDPTKYFELKKLGPKAIKEHLEKLAGQYAPEAVADRKLTETEQRIKDLEEKLASKEAAEHEQRLTQAEREGADAFITHVKGAADTYPHLTNEFTEAQATEIAFAELRKVVGQDAAGKPITLAQAYYRDHGVYPDNDVIAEHLDSIAKARIEARQKSGWRPRGDAPQVRQTLPNGDDVLSAPPVTGTSPRKTLQARDTSQRATTPQTGWSQEAADEESIRMLEASIRSGKVVR